MNINTGVWIGLGVLGAIIIASMGNDDSAKSKSVKTKEPKIEPKKVLGPSGSIIIGDTKCFHKGSPVISNPRLVLQPTFGPSNLLKINKK